MPQETVALADNGYTPAPVPSHLSVISVTPISRWPSTIVPQTAVWNLIMMLQAAGVWQCTVVHMMCGVH